MKKSRIIMVVFVFYILLVPTISIIVKDREFSDMENRNLQTFPKVTVKSIFSGEFMDEFEKYMSDQIVAKDQLVMIANTEKTALNQKVVNEVYHLSDNRIVQNYIYDEKQLKDNLNNINMFADDNPGLECTMLIAPTAAYVYYDELPKGNICDSQEMAINYIMGNVSENINLLDVSESLILNKDKDIYFKTDHHWTQAGAYLGYEKLCEGLGITATPADKFFIYNTNTEFYGSLYSKAPLFSDRPDEVLLYENEGEKYNVHYEDDGTKESSLYKFENLGIKDKYTVYLGGNHAMVRIVSLAEEKEPVIVVKDSYAHALLPFLADNYAEIYVVDLRYYHESVSKLAEEKGVKKIIFINNIDFLTTDKNFLWLY